ncbi:MAG: MYXO-CTERM sorting domain-containing protein, partial [Archangium sp.]
AGQPEVDAGVPDAGTDAGVIDVDAGVIVDAGVEQPMGGGTGGTGGGSGTMVEPGTDTRKITDGCGCTSGTEPLSILAFLGLLLVRRRTQR